MIVEDLALYFADFGSDVVVGAAVIKGIFDARPAAAFGMVDVSGPVLTVAAQDWPGVTRGATCTIASTQWRVIGIEPDGTGLCTLQLERAA